MYIHIYIHTRICRLCVLYLPVPVPLPLLLFSFCFFPSLSLSLSILLFDTEGTMGVIHFFTYTERYKPAVLFQRWPVSKGHFAVHPHESARSGAGGKELLHLFMMSAQQTYSVRSVDFQFSKLGNTNMRPPRMCGEMCGGWLCTWMLPSLYTWWQHSWLHVGNTLMAERLWPLISDWSLDVLEPGQPLQLPAMGRCQGLRSHRWSVPKCWEWLRLLVLSFVLANTGAPATGERTLINDVKCDRTWC